MNATLRIRGISEGDFNDLLSLVESMSRAIQVVETHTTQEAPASKRS
jgi:hypothetical protein